MEIAGRDVVILGAGGVARAVAVMLLDQKAAGVHILNRTVNKAQAVAEEINEMAGKTFARAYALTDYRLIPGEDWLVIQATSAGMHPRVEEAPIEDGEFYRHVGIGYDLIFNPGVTRFMKLTKGGEAVPIMEPTCWYIRGLLPLNFGQEYLLIRIRRMNYAEG